MQKLHSFFLQSYIDNEQRLRGSGAVMARFGFSMACPGDLNKDGFNGSTAHLQPNGLSFFFPVNHIFKDR